MPPHGRPKPHGGGVLVREDTHPHPLHGRITYTTATRKNIGKIKSTNNSGFVAALISPHRPTITTLLAPFIQTHYTEISKQSIHMIFLRIEKKSQAKRVEGTRYKETQGTKVLLAWNTTGGRNGKRLADHSLYHKLGNPGG